MASAKKTVMKEMLLWKKRFNESKRVLNGVYKDVSKDAKKAYKQMTK